MYIQIVIIDLRLNQSTHKPLVIQILKMIVNGL